MHGVRSFVRGRLKAALPLSWRTAFLLAWLYLGAAIAACTASVIFVYKRIDVHYETQAILGWIACLIVGSGTLTFAWRRHGSWKVTTLLLLFSPLAALLTTIALVLILGGRLFF